MPHFFIILLKINLVLILFAAAYYFILRKLTFYVINRLFLVFGILFSTIYPFIDLTDFFHQQNQRAVAFVPEINQQVKSLIPSNLISEYWQWIGAFFYIGVAFMAFRLFIQFISLIKIHRKSSPGIISNFKVRILNEAVGPFSFWQTVYINPALHNENELNTILTHEQIHVKQWHTLDIILAELSVVFYWFNPGIWLMKRAVKENLEFITDEKILKRGMDKKAYQYSLLDVGNLVPAVEIVNNFNLSDLKKRIKMMNAKRSSKFSLSRYLLVLPILLLTTLAFTVAKKEEIRAQLKPLKNVLVKIDLLDKVAETTNLPAQKLSKAKKSVKQKIKADTVKEPIRLVINANYINQDSLVAASDDVKIKQFSFSYKTNSKYDDQANLEKPDRKIILIKTDTVGLESLKGKIENIILETKSEILGDKNNATAKPRKVTITAIKTNLNDPSKDNQPINYYFNDIKITKEELAKIKADQIKKVSVVKGENIGEIRIIGVVTQPQL
ncbi:MAG: hypothetical protein EOO47_08860 [Flavobacterium sp.]|nr:MAG: hypothetical protein EOO47_08860 [Flavobacterium sp.]